jgi:hypothetical protein
MKSISNWKNIIVILAVIFSNNGFAVTPEEEEAMNKCVKPKFRDFMPAHMAEALPGSEISFHVKVGADTNSIIATAKNEKMPVTVTDKKNFLLVKAKLPASLGEGPARLHVAAKAADGGCLGQDGWLIFIKGGAGKNEASGSK